jgi:glycosyltransferase involved in cell wall biosynthesis
MAKYLRGFGHEVTVLTHSYTATDLKKPDVIRVKDISHNKNRKGIYALIWLVLRLYSELLTRRGRYHSIYHWWRKRVIKYSHRIISTVKPDVIIATYPPVETLEIGVHFSQTYDVPFVCDFRDGILFEPIERPRMERFPCVRRRYVEIERAAVVTSRAVITIADPITDYFKRAYGKRAVTIAKGFDPDDFQDIPVPAVFDPSKFHIVFTGRFGLADGSNRVEFFFEALRQMIQKERDLRNRIRVHLVGDFLKSDLMPIKDLMHIGVVICHGLVSQAESIGFQQIADLLLIITLPDRTCSVSTKIFEYICSKKPILALTHATVLADIIKKTRTGWIVHPHDPEAIAQLLHRILSDSEFYNSLKPNLTAIDTYSIIFQIEKLDSLLNDVKGKHKK